MLQNILFVRAVLILCLKVNIQKFVIKIYKRFMNATKKRGIELIKK